MAQALALRETPEIAGVERKLVARLALILCCFLLKVFPSKAHSSAFSAGGVPTKRP